MKKSLLALAAMGAFAGAAQAQSSVTVYGILDVGFQGASTRGPVNVGTTANPVYQTARSNQTAFSGGGAQTTSRLGFRGTEDLGGGTRAFFTVEFGLSPTDATLSGNGNGGLFNRQTFVGLAQKGIGQFAIGTQSTPVHVAVIRTDPGQVNNMAGNVIYAVSGTTGQTETTAAYTVRYNNALTLQTERMAGFQINAIYNNNNTSGSQTAGGTNAGGGYTANNNEAYGGGINFVWNKLNVDAAYQTSKNTTWSLGTQTVPTALPSGASAMSAAGAFTAAAPLGTSVGQNQFYGAAVYDFGILKAYVQYINSKTVSNVNSNNYVERTAQQIGVRGNITKTIEGWASGGTGRLTAGANQGGALPAGQSTQNFTGYQLGANYWMSKRTNAYAIFGSTQVSSTSVNMSEGRSSYGIGVRHTF